jgi:hypothetical protein
LIETLAWAHERTPLANLIRWKDKPVALSIVQARLVGLAHFFCRLYIHLCGFLDCLHIGQIRLIIYVFYPQNLSLINSYFKTSKEN